MMADRPSGGDFFKSEKATVIVLLLAMLLLSSGCAYGVKPSANKVSAAVGGLSAQDAQVWLVQNGYTALRPEAQGPRVARGLCFERFDPPFSTALQFGDVVVRACIDEDGPLVLAKAHRVGVWRETAPVRGKVISDATSKRLTE